MLCPACYGKGMIQRDGAMRPCPECGGWGVLSCCEGLVAQPNDKPEDSARHSGATLPADKVPKK